MLSSHDGPSRKPEPARIWSNHSLPVTDIHVGRGGYRCRVVSASLDQTCRVIPNKAIEPVQEILVSIAYAEQQKLDKPAHSCSLASAFTAHAH